MSLLKKAVGNYHKAEDLPDLEGEKGVVIEPEAILAKRTVTVQGEQIQQLLVQWKGQGLDEATWEDLITIKSQFPSFSLEDKAQANGRGIVRPNGMQESHNEPLAHQNPKGPKIWQVYSRRGKRMVTNS